MHYQQAVQAKTWGKTDKKTKVFTSFAGPQFSDQQAVQTVTGAANNHAWVFVQVSATYDNGPQVKPNWDYTVYAYKYVPVGAYTICVVDHAHIVKDPNVDADWQPGRGFIPGWPNWDTPTPQAAVDALRNQYKQAVLNAIQTGELKPNQQSHKDLHGAYPSDAERYPHQ